MHSVLRFALAGLALGAMTALSGFSPEHHKLTLAVQATGTVKWELAAMHELGIDEKHMLELTINDVADSPAGQVVLQAKGADLILSDFVWVNLQRHQGNKVAMVPHSLTVGGLMVDPAAGINSIADLKGKTMAVSGSPTDKSFVILSADYAKVTGGKLADDASIKFGAPPLINEIFTGGQAQASLNLWNWNSRAKLAGKTQLISIADMLKDLGVTTTPPLLGWTFFEDNALAHKEAFKAFFDASFETKKALLADDAVWDKIRPVMNVGDDDALFKQLRDDYRAGIVSQYTASSAVAAAGTSFEVMAKFGGPDVVGDVTDLDAGTFYKGYHK
jgi:NitT/TauT family transport system substrate-binding protein